MKTILYLDDDSASQKKLGEMLNKYCGYQVVFAQDGAEAAEAMRRSRPHILLVSAPLEKTDEFSVFIAEMPSPKPYIVVISEDSPCQNPNTCNLNEVFAYVSKPIRFGFLSRVLDCISTHSSPSSLLLAAPRLPQTVHLASLHNRLR